MAQRAAPSGGCHGEGFLVKVALKKGNKKGISNEYLGSLLDGFALTSIRHLILMFFFASAFSLRW